MATVIVKERPDSEDAAQLIAELEALLSLRYPKEVVTALVLRNF